MQLISFISELLESLIGTSSSLLRQFIITPTLGYIRWLTVFIWIPEIVDITIYHEILTKHWRIFPAGALAFLPLAIAWDYFAIKDGVWYFPESIVGLWFLNIPLEEYLFFVFVAWIAMLIFLFFYKVEVRRSVRKS